MKIFLAIDGSKVSEAATQAIIEHTKPDHSEVYVFTVVDLENFFTNEGDAERFDPHIKEMRLSRLHRAAELVERTACALRAAGYQTSVGVAEGDPKIRIVEAAEEWGADLIVMGSHGHGGYPRAMLGSVSEAVVHYASCSVEVVRIRPRK